MILRKPYAFLIKHFKLIHVILAFLVCYSIYYTKQLTDFFTEYSNTIINVAGQDLASTLTPILFQIIPFLIIVFSIILLVVMIVKKKPNLFYIINIISYIYTFVIVQISKFTLNTMALTLIDVRQARLIRDIITISLIIQVMCAVIIFIRATGFDIKKFNFKQDLKELDISPEDREEFEVEFSLDKNKIKTKLRKRIRFLKYRYKENKILFWVLSVIVIIFLSTSIYFGFFYKEKILSENTYFGGNGITLKITNSYLTNTDYKGNLIDEDNYYLILQIEAKGNNKKLEESSLKILIDNYVYTPTLNNKDSFFDFGKIYFGENIGGNLEKKVLVYEIPKELIDKEFIFSYVLRNTLNSFVVNDIKVSLAPEKLTETSLKEVRLQENLQLQDSILDDYQIKIDEYAIAKRFKVNYNFCVNKKDECYLSVEYLKADIISNYDKSLLKIKGSLIKENQIQGIYDLYDFIDNFGTLYYEIDGITKRHSVKLKEVVSSKVKKQDTYYIEVLDEVENADSIYLLFNVRDKQYKYILK